MVDILKKELDIGFNEAVEKVQVAVSKNFSVLLVKSISDVLIEKLKLPDYKKMTTILACNAKIAKMSLDVSTDVGTLMPCSFTVSEENSKVIVSHISIMKIASELNIANADKMRPIIEETGKLVQDTWNQI